MSEQDRVQLSVVIPTFNGLATLADTVVSVLGSDLADEVQLEVIVVDDGSAAPVGTALADLPRLPGRSLRVVRQENRGVGAARNRGYREAAGDLVVFVDDDMVLLPRTLHGHLEAHRSHPGSVIFGRSPYVAQADANPFAEWVLKLDNDLSSSAEERVVPASIVASGHLSVDRTGPVSRWAELYADDMGIPVAEEFELSHRLAAHRIPVYMARHLIAYHNRTIDVDSFLRQQLGHGRGCAQAAREHPECLELEALRGIIHHYQRWSARRALWVILGSGPARLMLRRAARHGQRGRLGPLAPYVFKLSAGAWFSAGVRGR